MRKTTIDLKSLFQVFKKNWVLLVAVAIIGMLGAVIYAKTLVTPLYKSQISIMIDNRISNETNPTVGEVTSSQQLAATYMTLLDETVILEQAEEAMDGKYTVSKIRAMTDFTQVNDAMIIRITAETPSPDDSKALCDAIAKYGEIEIEKLYKVDNVGIVGTANTPVAPSSPNITMYALVGTVLGFGICYVVLFVLSMRDNTIKDKHTVKENFDLPFFGEIPSFTTTGRGYKKYGKYASKYGRDYGYYSSK